MAVIPWLRLWLPLGNTFLLIAVLETVDLIRNEIKDVGIFIYQGLYVYEEVGGFLGRPDIIFLTISISTRLVCILGLLWFGTIIKGNRKCLLGWIISTVVTSVGLIVFLIYNAVSAAAHDVGSRHTWSIAYHFVIFVVFNAYIFYIAGVTYTGMCRQEELHPIGKGLKYIWDYFSNESKIAAKFFLISEIVLDSEYLISRQFSRIFGINLIGHDGDNFPAIVTEEIVFRAIRILTNGLGVWLVVSERRRLFRWWCAFTFLLILVSSAIFVVLTVQWRGEDISITLAYFIMFPGHLLYRFVTLFFCLKYTRADFSNFVL